MNLSSNSIFLDKLAVGIRNLSVLQDADAELDVMTAFVELLDLGNGFRAEFHGHPPLVWVHDSTEQWPTP